MQNLDVHVQIMEILTAYIRTNAPAKSAPKLPEPPDYTPEDDQGWSKNFNLWKVNHKKALKDISPREDIQLTLSVIGRRSPEQRATEARWRNPDPMACFIFDVPGPELFGKTVNGSSVNSFTLFRSEIKKRKNQHDSYSGYRLDLSRTNLCRAALDKLNFSGTLFHGAVLSGAILDETCLNGAQFMGANLQRATLERADCRLSFFDDTMLQGASLDRANLTGSVFRPSNLQCASLYETICHGTILYWTKLQGANLSCTELQMAHFGAVESTGTNFSGANFVGAKFSRTIGANYADANLQNAAFFDIDFSQNLLAFKAIEKYFDNVFCDGTVILPPGKPRPIHWPNDGLNPISFNEEFKRWLASPADYRYEPPPAPPS